VEIKIERNDGDYSQTNAGTVGFPGTLYSLHVFVCLCISVSKTCETVCS